MANLEEMSKMLGNGINSLTESIKALESAEIDSDLSLRSMGALNTRLKDFEWFKHWLDDLQEKHWKQESEWDESIQLLKMVQ